MAPGIAAIGPPEAGRYSGSRRLPQSFNRECGSCWLADRCAITCPAEGRTSSLRPDDGSRSWECASAAKSGRRGSPESRSQAGRVSALWARPRGDWARARNALQIQRVRRCARRSRVPSNDFSKGQQPEDRSEMVRNALDWLRYAVGFLAYGRLDVQGSWRYRLRQS